RKWKRKRKRNRCVAADDRAMTIQADLATPGEVDIRCDDEIGGNNTGMELDPAAVVECAADRKRCAVADGDCACIGPGAGTVQYGEFPAGDRECCGPHRIERSDCMTCRDGDGIGSVASIKTSSFAPGTVCVLQSAAVLKLPSMPCCQWIGRLGII